MQRNSTTEVRSSTTKNSILLFHLSPKMNDDELAWLSHYVQDDEEADMIVHAALDALAESSDDEMPVQSREGRAPNKKRDFAGAYTKLVKDYFSGAESVYNEADFERRFRMSRDMFTVLWETVHGTDPFVQNRDATGKLGIHPLCRFTACLRHLAYGDAYDREDENLYISSTSLSDSVKALCAIVKQRFGDEYLNRCPTEEELIAIVEENSSKGFPGLFGSWDCKHFVWKNCPMRWAGQCKGHAEGGKKTLIMEAIADSQRRL